MPIKTEESGRAQVERDIVGAGFLWGKKGF